MIATDLVLFPLSFRMSLLLFGLMVIVFSMIAAQPSRRFRPIAFTGGIVLTLLAVALVDLSIRHTGQFGSTVIPVVWG